MGNYLTSPNSVKHSRDGRLGHLDFGSCAMQGWRVTMEDTHICHFFDESEGLGAPIALFGVYDGHGGPQVAQFVARHLVEELWKVPEFRKGRFDVALRHAYVALDNLLAREEAQAELLRFSRTSQQSSAQSPSEGISDMEAPTPNHEISPDQPPQFPPQLPKAATRSRQGAVSRSRLMRHGAKSKSSGRGEKGGFSPSEESSAGTGSGVLSPRAVSKSKSSSGSSPSAEDTASDTLLEQPQQHASGGIIINNTSSIAPKRTGSLNSAISSVFNFQNVRTYLSGMLRGLVAKNVTTAGGLAMFAGCTAVSVLLGRDQVVVANAGDSRCVLCRGDVAIELSKDHKPQLPEEKSRIYAAGGWLEMGRVNGNLNLSRAIGDLVYKFNTSLPPDQQIVSAVPDVTLANLTEQDEFLVIGCDGIWESSTSQEVVDFIRERINTSSRLSDILETLFEELLSPNPTLFECGCDNMTAILIDLKPEKRPRRPPATTSGSTENSSSSRSGTESCHSATQRQLSSPGVTGVDGFPSAAPDDFQGSAGASGGQKDALLSLSMHEAASTSEEELPPSGEGLST